jgi:sensor histidine kinase YesM
MRLSPLQKYFGITLLLSLVICLTIHFPLVLAALLEDGDNRYNHRHGTFDVGLVVFELVNTFLVTWLMFLLNYFIIRPFDKYRKLHLRSVLLSVFLTSLSVVLIILLVNHLKGMLGYEIAPRRHGDEMLFRSFFGSALVLGCIYIMRLIYLKQTADLEVEKLRSESLQSQFESLKNQVSPHFLFNSLTALKALVAESPETADKYIDHLSGVLRYTLQSNEKQTVTLAEEIESTESYIYLVRMRYDRNLTIVSETDPQFLSYRLPPLTIQTLVENAVKHNEISSRNPLTIHIKTTPEGWLEVTNPVREKLSAEEGTGIGLNNLSKQFQLLGEEELRICHENGEFRVVVPLIPPKP